MVLLILLFELIILFIEARLVSTSISFLLFGITKSKTITIRILALIFFPGVVLHELSHYFSATLLGVHTGTIEFLPHIEGDHVKLGSVQIAKTDPFRRFVIGVAPVVCGIGVLLGILYVFMSSQAIWGTNWFAYLVFLYSIFVIPNTMFSSRKDMEGAVPLVLVIAIFFIALYFAGVRIPTELFESFIKERGEIIKTISMLLLLPIGINAVVIIASKFVTRRF